MDRPFFVHTPKNIYGEGLVRCNNGVEYSLRKYTNYKEDIKNLGTDLQEAIKECHAANEAHIVEMWSHGAFI